MTRSLLQFFISGSVVVLATGLGQRVGQKWAGLLVAFPFWTILTYIFLTMDNKKHVSYHEYLISALVFMVPAAIFILCLLSFNRLNLWVGLGASLIVYSLVAVFVSRWV